MIGSIVANATNQANAGREVFLADDNDGILTNGTPHYADLVWACTQHNLPYPATAAPSNDECANAIVIGNGLSQTFTSVLATNSTPSFGCSPGGSDVWFRYYAGTAGT